MSSLRISQRETRGATPRAIVTQQGGNDLTHQVEMAILFITTISMAEATMLVNGQRK